MEATVRINLAIMGSYSQKHVGKEEISIVIHIDEDLDEQNKNRIEYQLLKLVGIQGVEFDKFRPHLLFVRYSPSLIEAYKIIGLLRSCNLHVQLIVGN